MPLANRITFSWIKGCRRRRQRYRCIAGIRICIMDNQDRMQRRAIINVGTIHTDPHPRASNADIHIEAMPVCSFSYKQYSERR